MKSVRVSKDLKVGFIEKTCLQQENLRVLMECVALFIS